MPSADLDQLPIHLAPAGFAAVILAVVCTLAGLSLLTVTLRSLVRAYDGLFGLDDGLMMVGLVLFLADCGVIAYGTSVGVGYRNIELPPRLGLQGIKYVIVWQLLYMTALGAIKSAICITLVRIAEGLVHRIVISTVVAMTCVTSLIGFVGVMVSCRPITAHWQPATGVCESRQVITYITYLVSVSSILTDLACAVIPLFILWRAQMRTRAKLSVAAVLTLGTFASVTTIARIPFLRVYREPENDFLYNIGYVVLLSTAECAIGLIAGSLPMLRRFVRMCLGRDDDSATMAAMATATVTPGASSRMTPLSFMTFGGTRPTSRRRRSTALGLTLGLGGRGRFGNPVRGVSRATVRADQPSEAWEKIDSGTGTRTGTANGTVTRPGTVAGPGGLARPSLTADDKPEAPSIYTRRSVTVEYEVRSLPALSETKSLPRFSRSSWADSLSRARSSSN